MNDGWWEKKILTLTEEKVDGHERTGSKSVGSGG